MYRTVVTLEDAQTLHWPRACPACGREIADQSCHVIEVKVRRSLLARFVRVTPKAVRVGICHKCAAWTARWTRVAEFGSGMVSLVFLGVIWVACERAPVTPEIMAGASAVFWLGAVLSWVAGARSRKATGVRCLLQSKTRWRFSFGRRSYRDRFSEMNSEDANSGTKRSMAELILPPASSPAATAPASPDEEGTARRKLRFACPKCSTNLRGATADMIGDIGVCAKCRHEFTICEQLDEEPVNSPVNSESQRTKQGAAEQCLTSMPRNGLLQPSQVHGGRVRARKGD